MAAVLSITQQPTEDRMQSWGGGFADEMRPRRNAWGGLFSVILGRRMGRQKRVRGGAGLGLKRPPLAEPTQQPAENSTGDGAT